MTPQQIVGLAVRIFAIFVALHSGKYLVGLPQSLTSMGMENATFISYGFGVFGFIVAAFLWFFPMIVAGKILPKTRFENHLNVQALDAARVGCSLIGLWFFANAIPNMLWYLFRTSISISSSSSIMEMLSAEDKTYIFFHVTQIVLAYVLIFKSHLFAAIVMRKIESKPKDE